MRARELKLPRRGHDVPRAGRASHGARELKLEDEDRRDRLRCVAPPGVRELK